MTRKQLSTLVVLLCFFATGVAQTKSDDDVVRITTNLVQVDVVVRLKQTPSQ